MFTRRHLLALAATPLLGQDESGFHALFDGRTLQGWEVKEGPESAFAVEEGAILVTEAANSPTWLATTKTYENFDLRHLSTGARARSGHRLRPVHQDLPQGREPAEAGVDGFGISARGPASRQREEQRGVELDADSA
jgi:hypothetical protein